MNKTTEENAGVKRQYSKKGLQKNRHVWDVESIRGLEISAPGAFYTDRSDSDTSKLERSDKMRH